MKSWRQRCGRIWKREMEETDGGMERGAQRRVGTKVSEEEEENDKEEAATRRRGAALNSQLSAEQQ